LVTLLDQSISGSLERDQLEHDHGQHDALSLVAQCTTFPNEHWASRIRAAGASGFLAALEAEVLDLQPTA